MTDIANLSYSVDSSELSKAERALDSHTAAAERSSRAADDVGDSYGKMADRGMERARQSAERAADAQESLAKSTGNLGNVSKDAQRSVESLTKAAVTGRWGQARNSVTSLAMSIGRMLPVLAGATVAIGGLGIAILAGQVIKARRELRTFEGMVIGMGNASGLAAGQLLDLRNEIGNVTGDFEGATQAVNQLVLSGKLSGEALEGVARSAGRLATLTGQSIGSVTNEIERMAAGGAEALLDFNDKYNILTISTWENIEAIREQDGELAALTATVREVERVTEERSRQMASHAGLVERAWKGVTREFRNAKRAMADWGRNDLQKQLADAETALRTQETRWRAQGIDPSEQRGVKAAQARVDALKEQVRVQGLVNKGLDAEQQWHNDTIREIDERREAERRAAEAMQIRIDQYNGLDSQVHRLRQAFEGLSEARQQEMIADGSYAALMEKAVEEDIKRNTAREQSSRQVAERKSEEALAVERMLAQFQQQEASMERQIELYGDTSRAAAMAYDIQTAGLAEVDAELARILQKNAEWLDFLDDMAALEGVWKEVADEHAEYGNQLTEQTDFMTEHAKQAARNMQSHFANFLFDPFADGTKSMGDAFSEVLRRMLAEAAASRLFEMIGTAMSAYTGRGAGMVNMVGGMLSPPKGKRYGGPVRGGNVYEVNEGGIPELLNTRHGKYLLPGTDGEVTPLSHAGSAQAAMRTPQININVQGNADVESATARQNPSGGFDVDVILRQVDSHIAGGIATGTGQTGRAMKSRYGLKEVV